MREVTSSGVRFVKYKELEPGDVAVSGVYQEWSDGEFGRNHKFKDDDGKTVVLPGSSTVNSILGDVIPPGSYVMVTYKGRVESKKKGHQPFHTFKFEVDDEKFEEVEPF